MHLIICATRNNNSALGTSLKKCSDEVGLESRVICLEDYELPLYTPSIESSGIPKKALELTELFISASCFSLCAPEYNGCAPPIVTNAIAWISRSGSEDWREAFNNKPAIVATHSGGGGLKVTQAMRAQLEHLGALVLPRPIVTNYQKQLNPESAKTILTQLKLHASLSA